MVFRSHIAAGAIIASLIGFPATAAAFNISVPPDSSVSSAGLSRAHAELGSTADFVDLLYFRAEVVGAQKVDMRWATAVGQDILAFKIYRAKTNDFGSALLIDVIAGVGYHAAYFTADVPPTTGTWWYWLASVNTWGYEEAPIAASVVVPPSSETSFRVYLPLAHGGGK